MLVFFKAAQLFCVSRTENPGSTIFPVLSEAVAISQEEDYSDEDHSEPRGGGEMWLDLSWNTRCAGETSQVNS